MARGPKPVFLPTFQALVGKYFDREWEPGDGLPAEALTELLADAPATEQLAGTDWEPPLALLEFYLALGNAPEVLETKHFFFDPDELEVRDEFLMFLEDDAESTVWGIPLDQISLPDPEVWVRETGADESEGEWSNEGGTVSELIQDILAWNLAPEEAEQDPARKTKGSRR